MFWWMYDVGRFHTKPSNHWYTRVHYWYTEIVSHLVSVPAKKWLEIRLKPLALQNWYTVVHCFEGIYIYKNIFCGEPFHKLPNKCKSEKTEFSRV